MIDHLYKDTNAVIIFTKIYFQDSRVRNVVNIFTKTHFPDYRVRNVVIIFTKIHFPCVYFFLCSRALVYRFLLVSPV